MELIGLAASLLSPNVNSTSSTNKEGSTNISIHIHNEAKTTSDVTSSNSVSQSQSQSQSQTQLTELRNEINLLREQISSKENELSRYQQGVQEFNQILTSTSSLHQKLIGKWQHMENPKAIIEIKPDLILIYERRVIPRIFNRLYFEIKHDERATDGMSGLYFHIFCFYDINFPNQLKTMRTDRFYWPKTPQNCADNGLELYLKMELDGFVVFY